MRYTSTRNSSFSSTFEEAIFSGFAPDGGLHVPVAWPAADWKRWHQLSFCDLALEIVSLFVSEEEVRKDDLRRIIGASAAPFADPNQVVALRDLPDRNNPDRASLAVLELWHGPTASFKDVAMQFVLQIQRHFLLKRRERLTLLIATTGDTGASAIHASRFVPEVECYVLYTRGHVSPLQEVQMLSPNEPNLHTISAMLSSDELDIVLRRLFADVEFRKQYKLSTVNSFNWGRVLYQIVYYVYAYFRWCDRHHAKVGTELTFITPSGGFGNGFGGIMAAKLGLPLRIVGATNSNDILRKLSLGSAIHTPLLTTPTMSSCMDIMVPSNLERLLYTAGCLIMTTKEAAALTKKIMISLTESHGVVQIPVSLQDVIGKMTSFASVSEDETKAAIRNCFDRYGYIIDPHTAVAYHVLQTHYSTSNTMLVSTANPIKFAETIKTTLQSAQLPSSFAVDLAQQALQLSLQAQRVETTEEAETLLRKLIPTHFRTRSVL